MKYSKIIIDGHNLYHRNYHVNKNLTFNVEGHTIITGGVYGFLRSLNMLKREYLSEAGQVYILFDNSHSKIESRRKLDPEYKNNRSELPKSFYRGVEFLQLILLRYDNDQFLVYRHSYEADDLVESIISQFSEYDRTLLVSTDLDWARSIRDNVHWLSKDTLYTPKSFEKEFSFPPSHSNVCFYKAFKGDPADNIKNPIPRFPFETLTDAIMPQYRDVYELYEGIHSGSLRESIGENWVEKLKDSEVREQLYRNWELVAFEGEPYSSIADAVFECSYSEKKKKSLGALYTLLGFQPKKLDKRFEDDGADPLIGWDTI